MAKSGSTLRFKSVGNAQLAALPRGRLLLWRGRLQVPCALRWWKVINGLSTDMLALAPGSDETKDEVKVNSKSLEMALRSRRKLFRAF